MAAPTVYWLTQVSKAAGKMIPLFGTIAAFFAWLYDLGERVVVGGLNYLIERVREINVDAFSDASFGTIAGIGYFNAVFPLSEAITIWTALITAKLTIILIRWIKSFVPTIAN